MAPDGGQITNNGGTFLVPAFASGLCNMAYVGNANSAVLDIEGGTVAFNGLGSSGYAVEQNSGTIQIAITPACKLRTQAAQKPGQNKHSSLRMCA